MRSHMDIYGPVFAAWPALAAAAGAVSGAFVAGCLAGSFLNVVAHRVPRGETVVFGRSRCPACRETIRSRDNIPVLGWILLRGRCRDCGAAIAPRYPLIEAGCGALAAVLAAAELAGGRSDAAVLTAWCGRTAVALVIVAWSLLGERGHIISRNAVATAGAVAALAAAAVPALAPLPACCRCPGWASPTAWTGCLVASFAGATTGWLAATDVGGPARAACCLVGAAFGWQTACVAALAAWTGRMASQCAAAGCLATVAAIVGWHPLTRAWDMVCRAAAG